MFKLKTGYVITGIITGCILLFTFFSQLPDGKLHIVFCSVGQGDAAYITFPGGADMLIDGGPGGKTPKVIGCLGKHMSLFDRTIDVVVLTHPQEDHLGGLEEVLKRYEVKNFVHSDVGNSTEGYAALINLIHEKHIAERIVATGENITIGSTHIAVLWPISSLSSLSNPSNVNDASIILKLSYGTFDALFPGDAPLHQSLPAGRQGFEGQAAGDTIEVLKVPHHGSKTGMTDGFLQWLGHLRLAIISVGKNSYGHPAQETISRLEKIGAKVLRTDEEGDIEIVSDGRSWSLLVP